MNQTQPMKLFSTEQVSKYHPDKFADQISDAVLDACLAQDPHSHVACETMVKGETVILAGEITTAATINYAEIVQKVAQKLKYRVSNILTYIDRQSPEIAKGVGDGAEQGAGDQGMMHGFACADTETMLPFGFDLANKIIAAIEKDVETNPETCLLGDAKCQVTVNLLEPPTIHSVVKILVSGCHKPECNEEYVRHYLWEIASGIVNDIQTHTGSEQREDLEYIINPAGAWTIGGPTADCGLTGRKIVCDQYGGYCPVGGGAFSGKDPSKVDRSGAYMARKIACDLIQRFNMTVCNVQLAYAIGKAEPVSITVMCGDPAWDDKMAAYVKNTYDLTPAGIIKELDLLHENYEKLAEGCHYRYGGAV